MSFKDKYLKYKYKYLELKQIIQTGQICKVYLNLEGGGDAKKGGSAFKSGTNTVNKGNSGSFTTKNNKNNNSTTSVDSDSATATATATAGGGGGNHVRFKLESDHIPEPIERTKTGGNGWADIVRNIIKKILQPTLHRMIRTSIDNLFETKKVQLSTDPEINYQNILYFYDDADHQNFYDDINKFETKICVGYVLESSSETIKIIKGLINEQIPQLIQSSLRNIIKDSKELGFSKKVIEEKLKKTIDEYIDNHIGPADLDINMLGFKPFPIIIVKPDPNTPNEKYIDSIYATYTDGIIANNERFILPDRKNVQFADILLGNIMFKQLVYRAESE